MAKRGLGRGIEALLQTGQIQQGGSGANAPASATSPVAAGAVATDAGGTNSAGVRVSMLAISSVSPDPDQPRKEFDMTQLDELADSIREKGVLQPILVSQLATGGFRIIAGERRYRAALQAGLKEIPAIVRDFDEQERREVALIENIQRTDLNPLEEAAAYRELMTMHGLSQEELSKRLGKNRSTIANAMRLLKLPAQIQEAIRDGSLSSGHARALLAIDDEEARGTAFRAIQSAGLSVRDAEALSKLINSGIDPAQALPALRGAAASATEGGDDAQSPENAGISEEEFAALTMNMAGTQGGARARGDGEKGGNGRSLEIQEIEELLITRLGTKVSVRGNHRTGKIEIRYFSLDDLERLLEIMGVSSD